MRYLAIDLGEKRSGLAGGDDVIGLAQPLQVLDVPLGAALLEAILARIDEIGPDALVIGLPLNMDGSEGSAAAAVRSFAMSLGERTGLVVHLQDERLTSFDAESKLARSGRTHGEKKALRDALAAAAILEDFLKSRRQ